MLKIEGKYLKAKPVVGSKKTLLVTFSTKAGNLDLIVSSDQWMHYFVSDNAPKKDSNWQLVVQAKAIPELNQTMLGLIRAKPQISNPAENLDKVVDLLQKIYTRMGNIKQDGNQEPAISKSVEEDDDNNQTDYEAVAQDYQPKVEVDSKEEETDLPEVPDEQTRQFSLDQQPAKKPNPEDSAVDQGTGDSVTGAFFKTADSDEDGKETDDSNDNDDPQDDSLGDGPLNLTDALS